MRACSKLMHSTRKLCDFRDKLNEKIIISFSTLSVVLQCHRMALASSNTRAATSSPHSNSSLAKLSHVKQWLPVDLLQKTSNSYILEAGTSKC